MPCCPPLIRERLDSRTAALLAPAFKALGDPVRLRLLSMIASAEGGEITRPRPPGTPVPG